MLQIAGAGIAAGISAIGGSSANRAARKEAALARSHEHDIMRENYQQTQDTNNRIERYNADVLANHSTSVTKVTDESGWTNSTSSVGSIDFVRLVADSEANGFNPISVLRAGGLAGYFTTNTVATNQNFGTVTTEHRAARDVMHYIGPNSPISPSGPPALSNPFEGAAAILGNAAASFDPYAADRREIERGIGLAQIRNLDSDTAANARRFAIPSWTGSASVSSPGGFTGAARAVLGGTLGRIAPFQPGEVTVTNPWADKYVDPSLADAEAIETRYGEAISEAAGVRNAIGDTIYNGRHNPNANAGSKAAAAIADLPTTISQNFRNSYKAMVRAWNALPSVDPTVRSLAPRG